MNKDEGYTPLANKIVRSKELDIYEKMLFAVLLSYNGNEKIFPSHTTLANESGMSRSKVIRSLKSLSEKGYIVIAKDSEHRTNTYSIQKKGVYDNNSGVYRSDSDVYDRNTECVRGTQGGVYDRNTNNKSINIKSIKEEILLSGSQTNTDVLPLENLKKKKPEDKVDYQTILDCLNNATGKNFRLTDAFKRKVNGRLNEKYTVDDFKKVISNMASEWRGKEMEKYLTPDTLFGSKFDTYLNYTVAFSPGSTRKKLN